MTDYIFENLLILSNKKDLTLNDKVNCLFLGGLLKKIVLI